MARILKLPGFLLRFIDSTILRIPVAAVIVMGVLLLNGIRLESNMVSFEDFCRLAVYFSAASSFIYVFLGRRRGSVMNALVIVYIVLAVLSGISKVVVPALEQEIGVVAYAQSMLSDKWIKYVVLWHTYLIISQVIRSSVRSYNYHKRRRKRKPWENKLENLNKKLFPSAAKVLDDQAEAVEKALFGMYRVSYPNRIKKTDEKIKQNEQKNNNTVQKKPVHTKSNKPRAKTAGQVKKVSGDRIMGKGGTGNGR